MPTDPNSSTRDRKTILSKLKACTHCYLLVELWLLILIRYLRVFRNILNMNRSRPPVPSDLDGKRSYSNLACVDTRNPVVELVAR